jgi:hypothetical protein
MAKNKLTFNQSHRYTCGTKFMTRTGLNSISHRGTHVGLGWTYKQMFYIHQGRRLISGKYGLKITSFNRPSSYIRRA